MKPQPPDTLLGPGQAWTVVQATRWSTVSGRDCNAKWNVGDFEMCRLPAVIFDSQTTFANGDVLCERHMGFYRWVEDGVVYQWKADPPWVYGEKWPRLLPKRQKEK